jgi:hypothetical protein
MGVQNLGPVKHRRCEAIVGHPFIRCHTTDMPRVARCWVDRHYACLVDYGRGRQMSQITRQENSMASFDAPVLWEPVVDNMPSLRVLAASLHGGYAIICLACEQYAGGDAAPCLLEAFITEHEPHGATIAPAELGQQALEAWLASPANPYYKGG